jgi:hypothetical protein
MISDRFLPESTGNWQEFTEKIRKTSGRNTASISEEFPVLSHGIR